MGFEKTGMRTSSGARVYIDSPWESEIRTSDIALSLARQCRFAGHLRPHIAHYSVAQHSVLVSYLSRGHELVGLLHDVTEAFVQDLIRPLKRAIASDEYTSLEAMWAACLGHHFGVGDQLLNLPDAVLVADQVALITEMRDVYWDIEHEMHFQPMDRKISPLPVFAAHNAFVQRLNELRHGSHELEIAV